MFPTGGSQSQAICSSGSITAVVRSNKKAIKLGKLTARGKAGRVYQQSYLVLSAIHESPTPLPPVLIPTRHSSMEKRKHPTSLLSSILPGKADPTRSRMKETGGSEWKTKGHHQSMQLGLVHSSVTWQTGRVGDSGLFFFFIVCLFSAGSYGGRGQLLAEEIAGHLSKAWNCHFSLWGQGAGSTPVVI